MRVRPLMLSMSFLPLLVACGNPQSDPLATAPVAPSAQQTEAARDSEDVVVSTNEPFWQARVEGDTLVLTGVDAEERRLSGATASMTADGRRIAARDADGEVVVIVRRMRCEDDMSGARFPMTGLLTIDGRGPYRGCARPASMPAPRPPEEIGADLPARLPDAFVGRWNADAAECASPERGDMGLVVESGRLTFHESVATPTRVEQLDADTIRVTSESAGEGERWTDVRTLRLVDGGERLVADGDGTSVTRVRCGD